MTINATKFLYQIDSKLSVKSSVAISKTNQIEATKAASSRNQKNIEMMVNLFLLSKALTTNCDKSNTTNANVMAISNS